VLVRNSVFVEHLRHFLGDHVTIVLNGNERNFFSHFGHGLGSRTFGTLGWTLWCLTHRYSIHEDEGEKGGLFSFAEYPAQRAAEARRGEPSVALAKEGSGFGEFRRIPRSLLRGASFKRFQGGTLWVCFLARGTGQEIDGFSDRHGDTKIEAYASLIAGRTGHFFKPVGDIRLCAQVELHIRVDWEGVVAFSADASPFTVRLHKAFIDPKA
jgi:hypothetical protein